MRGSRASIEDHRNEKRAVIHGAFFRFQTVVTRV